MLFNKELKVNFGIVLIVFLIKMLDELVLRNKFISIHYFSFGFVSIVIYAVNFYFAAKYLMNRNIISYLIWFLGLVLLFMSLRYLLEEVIILHLTGSPNYYGDNYIGVYMYDSIYYTFRIVLLSSLVYFILKSIESKEKINELNSVFQKAQLSALKSHISPHFLFNTLNNFYVELIDDKPKTAKDILKLSDLMRFVTYETKNDFIQLKKELNFIENYLHFYKRRYEDSYAINFSINGIITNQLIPNLILLHFVENVCKHGIINNSIKPSVIRINILENHLELFTENHCNTSYKYFENGISTENTTKRLDLVFEGKYTLKNSENNTIFKSYLKIPLK